MSNPSIQRTSTGQALTEIWFTRCPVPTATGIAYRLGWFDEEFAADGISVKTIQDAPRELSRHHYDHEIPTLVREGGSLLALAARAQGARTRLIGLTWIDEWQTILVRADSGITEPRQLKGLRVALPAFVDREIKAHTRGSSIARGMSLQGIKGALATAGLSIDDVQWVEVESGNGNRDGAGQDLGSLWAGLQHLADGNVDAVYVKGASASDAARQLGLEVGIDLDALPDRRSRVNNGTPRPITVHEDFLETHFDVVVRFLAQTLRAADWAADNLAGVRAILQGETRAGLEGVSTAYRNDFHRQLHPELSAERLELFAIQKNFMLLHGFLDRDFSLDAWVDPRPLSEARRLLLTRERSAA